MNNFNETFPTNAQPGDKVTYDGIEFTYYPEKSGWFHEEVEDHFNYINCVIGPTTSVFIRKTLIDEKGWWNQ
jgi:hypothetical protein